MFKKLFFGYLPNKNKIIARLTSIVLIILSPIFYYKTIDGIFIEDIIAMYFYSGGLELFWFWIFSLITICLISFVFFLILPKK